MRIILISSYLASAALFSARGYAAAVDAKLIEMHICKITSKGTTTRIVRTVKLETQEDLCLVKYSRDQQEKTVGQTKTVPGCRKIADSIKINLEKAGWKCRTTSKAQATESQEAASP